MIVNDHTTDFWRKYEVTETSNSLNLGTIKLDLIVYF